MKKNIKKNLFSRLLSPKLLTLIGLVIIVLMSIPVAKNVSQRYEIDEEINDLRNEIKMIESKNTKLTQLIDYLGSDQYVEEQARLNFSLKKPGEEVVIINEDGVLNGNDSKKGLNGDNGVTIDDSITSDSIYNIPGPNKEKKIVAISNPQKWWVYFFKK